MKALVTTGERFTSRGGAEYTVTAILPKGRARYHGFTIERASTGKTVRISGKLLESLIARIGAGESFAYQANGKNGGISYTVAIEAGAVYALRNLLTRDDANRCYRSKGA